MEPGHSHLQIVMSVALIFTAAVVAFICDVLKRNNDRLREMNIELKIRKEVEHRRSHVPAPPPARTPAPVPGISAPKERSILNKEKKRAVNPEALAVMERGAALAGSVNSSRSAAIRESKPVSAAIRKDWGSLLSRNAQGIKPAPAPPAEWSLPAGLEAGFHDGFVLNKLVQSRQPVSGLVVSIGVNAPRNSEGKLPEGVLKLVESLIGPRDFAAQSAVDEFLLIYPQERGASAQRRLSRIAQQLWDFQLRSLGSFQILFSWGGIEVSSESIDEAIASASERMQETKRSRKLLTMESAAVDRPLRLAV
jgi:hypothetical protein